MRRCRTSEKNGDLGAGLARMAYGVAATGVVVWLWQIVLGRLSTRAASNSRVRTVSEAASLVPRVFRGRTGPVYVTAGKELRYMRRDPRFRSQAVGLVIALAALGFGAGRFLLGTEYAPVPGDGDRLDGCQHRVQPVRNGRSIVLGICGLRGRSPPDPGR